MEECKNIIIINAYEREIRRGKVSSCVTSYEVIAFNGEGKEIYTKSSLNLGEIGGSIDYIKKNTVMKTLEEITFDFGLATSERLPRPRSLNPSEMGIIKRYL
ncbi:MAG TPA: hypothetical protein VI564_02080 [Candidatus Nanoarchaeia archaeon]|nr:hypothetical protein [Candidatus Nanoarchaeia archaeon]